MCKAIQANITLTTRCFCPFMSLLFQIEIRKRKYDRCIIALICLSPIIDYQVHFLFKKREPNAPYLVLSIYLRFYWSANFSIQ